jgi:hypothetical protein
MRYRPKGYENEIDFKCPLCGEVNRFNRTFCWKCDHDFREKAPIRKEVGEMGTRSLDTESGADSMTEVLVPTYKAWPAWERGLLRIGVGGMEYVPIARSWASIGVLVGILLWYSYGVVATVGVGILGKFVWYLVGAMLAGLCSWLTALPMRKRAMAQEMAAKTRGMASVSPLSEGGWEAAWDQVAVVSVGSPGPSIFVTTVGGSMHKFVLLGKTSALGFVTASESAEAAKKALGRFAPGKLQR